MTVFHTAAGGDRRRMPASASAPAGVARPFRRSPRVGPPPLLPTGFAAGLLAGPVAAAQTASAEAIPARTGRTGRPVSRQEPPPPPPVRRGGVRNGILWAPDLMDWLYQCRASGVAVTVLARTLGCTTQTLFTQFRRDARGVPGAPPPTASIRRISPRDFARWGRGRAEDMPADVLAREVSRGTYPPIGPLTRLSPRRRIGRPLDLAYEPDFGEGDG